MLVSRWTKCHRKWITILDNAISRMQILWPNFFLLYTWYTQTTWTEYAISKPKSDGYSIYSFSEMDQRFFELLKTKTCIFLPLTKYQCWITNAINVIYFRLKLCTSIFVGCMPCNGQWTICYKIRAYNIQFDAFVE